MIVPDEPPALTPAAARTLLRILLNAAATGRRAARGQKRSAHDRPETGCRLAFWGRVSTEDNQDPESSRGWQLTRAKALIEPHGGHRRRVLRHRQVPLHPAAAAAAGQRAARGAGRPERGFEAVVVGEPQRAFYGNQFGNTFPLFAHYGVPLWVPEVGGPIDPDNEAHDLIMSRVRRGVQGRAEPDQDPRPHRHGRPGPARFLFFLISRRAVCCCARCGGHGQDALGDAVATPRSCATVAFEVKLAFEGVVDRFDQLADLLEHRLAVAGLLIGAGGAQRVMGSWPATARSRAPRSPYQ